MGGRSRPEVAIHEPRWAVSPRRTLSRAASHRTARRHELGVLRRVLPLRQRGGPRPPRRPALRRLRLRSVDFTQIEPLQRAGDWDEAGALLAAEAQALVAAGAELIVLCTNTMHKVADAITDARRRPVRPHRRHHRRGGPRPRPRHRRPARHRVHDGAGLLRRPPARPPRADGAHARRRRPRARAPASSTRSCASASSATPRARSTAAIMRALADRGAAGDPARLHRDRPAGRPAGRAGAGVRHDAPARRARGRLALAGELIRPPRRGRGSRSGRPRGGAARAPSRTRRRARPPARPRA